MSRRRRSREKEILSPRVIVPCGIVVILALMVRSEFQSSHDIQDLGLQDWHSPLLDVAVTETSDQTEPGTATAAGSGISLDRFWGTSDDTELHPLPAPESSEGPVVGLVDVPQEDTTFWETFETPGELTMLPPATEPAVSEEVAGTPQTLPQKDVTRQEDLQPEFGELVELPAPEVPGAGEPSCEVRAPEVSIVKTPRPQARQPRPSTTPIVAQRNLDELSAEERHLLAMIERDALAISTGTLTDSRLDERAREKISSACELSQRGATFAARQELVEVLRMVSQAKDKRERGRIRSESLAAGLRALEEADDFVPRGTQLEADMALEVICASHRTPIGRRLAPTGVLPAQMADRYNRYAQIKLALAVAGEPAGSMALYTLGKLNSQLSIQEPEEDRQCQRRALAYQQAALLAHNENYLAAHELGVLLAETGHLRAASNLFAQVAQRQPNAVVYRNLARVQEELGQSTEARFCRTEAARLANRGLGAPGQVAWMSPEDFVRSAPTNPAPQLAQRRAPNPYR